MSFKFKSVLALALTAGALACGSAQAALGDYLVVQSDGNVVLTFEGSSAGYDSLLSVNGSPQIFPNHSTPVGSTYDLGFMTAGTVLDAVLHVVNTGVDFHSGPGSLNPDGFEHAVVIENWNSTGRTYVGFEDIFGTPNGAGDYDDHTFSFSNTSVSATVPTLPVPEPGTYAMMLAGLGVMGVVARRQKTGSAN